MDSISYTGYIYLWAGLGYFLLLLLPSPKTKPEAWFKLFLCGPLTWVLFIPVSINVWRKNKRDQS